jgi:hypothetical protein
VSTPDPGSRPWPPELLTQFHAAVKAKAPKVVKTEIESVLADLRVNTTMQGASTLEIDIIDPGWLLITSGFLDKGADDKFDVVDLNYPEGSDYWWRLTLADPSTGLDGPNLTLTFETRVVSYARGHSGVKSWSRGQFTRAQAIKAMTADEIKAPPKPVFVSPELDAKQTIQASG